MSSPDILEKFRLSVLRTLNPDVTPEARLLNGVLGLCGESGEVADLIKKVHFQGHQFDTNKLKSELGDILWYLFLVCDTAGLTVEEVLEANIQKLQKRYPEGFSVDASVNRPPENND